MLSIAPGSRFRHYGSLFFVMALSAAVYARTLGFQYLWDDLSLVAANPLVQGQRPFWQVFGGHFFSGADAGTEGWMYRPLVLLSFRWGWALSPNPAFAHAINVGLQS